MKSNMEAAKLMLLPHVKLTDKGIMMELHVKSYEMLSKDELFNIICERINVL